MQESLGNKLVKGLGSLVVRIDLNQRFRPVPSLGVFGIYRLGNVFGADLGEATGERGIFVHQLMPELKDIRHAERSGR